MTALHTETAVGDLRVALGAGARVGALRVDTLVLTRVLARGTLVRVAARHAVRVERVALGARAPVGWANIWVLKC